MKNILKNDIEQASDLGKVLYILLLPIRKFYIVVPILALIYVTPVFFEVNPRAVHIWYKDKAIEIYENVIKTPFISKAINKVEETFGIDKTISKETKNNIKLAPSENLVEMNKPRSKVSKRKTFEKSDEIYKFDIKQDTQNQVAKEEYANAVEEELAPKEDEKTAEVIKGKTVASINMDRLPDSDTSRFKLNPNARKLPITYLETPKDITGKALIVNSNEIEVNGIHILLYGIYIHPLTADGKRSQAYLEEVTADKDVKCSIVAYTMQKVATAVCFVGDENLNETLVKLGITKNIAL